MPDIPVNITATDNLTPTLKEIKSALNEMGTEAERAGQQIYNWSQKFKVPTAVLGTEEQSQIKDYLNFVERLKKSQAELREQSGTTFRDVMRGQAAGGGVAGRLVRDLVWGAESFLRYMVVWKTLDTVLQGVEKTFASVGNEINAFTQLQNTLGGGTEHVTSTFLRLNEAALLTGTGIQETTKRFWSLYSAGLSEEAAAGATQMIQQHLRATGDDLTKLTEKAAIYQATAKDVLEIAKPGTAFAELRPEALQLYQAEAVAPLQRQMMERQHVIQSRLIEDEERQRSQALQDQHIRESDYMEDRHRNLAYYLEDEQVHTERTLEIERLGIQREMEDRFYMRNREMELTHRNMQQEMQDRHRFASQREADEARFQSRRVGLAAAMPGAMDVLAGRATFKTPAMGFVGAQILGPEFEKGLQQIQKETGVTADQIREAMREGMSPGIVLQFAEAAREEERIAKQRQRETEEIKLQRQIQIENFDEAGRQHDESRKVQRELADKQREANWSLADQRRELTRALAADEIAMTRRHRQEDIQLQRDIIKERINLERPYQDERMKFELQLALLQLNLNEKLIAILNKEADAAVKRAEEAMAAVTGGARGEALPSGEVEHKAPEPIVGEDFAKTVGDLRQQYQDAIDGINKNRQETDRSTQAIEDNTDKQIEQTKKNTDLNDSVDEYHDKVNKLNGSIDDQINKTKEATQAVTKPGEPEEVKTEGYRLSPTSEEPMRPETLMRETPRGGGVLDIDFKQGLDTSTKQLLVQMRILQVLEGKSGGFGGVGGGEEGPSEFRAVSSKEGGGGGGGGQPLMTETPMPGGGIDIKFAAGTSVAMKQLAILIESLKVQIDMNSNLKEVLS